MCYVYAICNYTTVCVVCVHHWLCQQFSSLAAGNKNCLWTCWFGSGLVSVMQECDKTRTEMAGVRKDTPWLSSTLMAVELLYGKQLSPDEAYASFGNVSTVNDQTNVNTWSLHPYVCLFQIPQNCGCWLILKWLMSDNLLHPLIRSDFWPHLALCAVFFLNKKILKDKTPKTLPAGCWQCPH